MPHEAHSTDAFQHHDHAHCVAAALAKAESVCNAQGVRLTELRKRVLELVWTSHKPLGAYHILDSLTQEGHKPAPPTVYRALDFLLENGLVHKIHSLNAFIGCADSGHPHQGGFLICRRCGNAEEMLFAEIASALKKAAKQQHFKIESSCVEVLGVCQLCLENKE